MVKNKRPLEKSSALVAITLSNNPGLHMNMLTEIIQLVNTNNSYL